MLKKLVSTYKSDTKIVDHLFMQQLNLNNKKKNTETAKIESNIEKNKNIKR